MHRPALAGVLLAAAALAQQTVAPPTARHDAILATKDGLVLPAGEFGTAELIDAVATFLCRNYLYDPAVVTRTAPFTLHKAIALDALGSEELLHALLATRELAAIPLDELRGVHEIVGIGHDAHAASAARVPWRSPEEILGRPSCHDLVMTAVELHHADAEQMARALRDHFAPAGAWRPGVVTACASGPRLLLLHGYRDQLARILMLARRVDRAAEPVRDPLHFDRMSERVAALEREVADLRRLLEERSR